jgi:hypothetical protein
VNHFVIENEATSVFFPCHPFEAIRTLQAGVLRRACVIQELKNQLFFERQLAYVFITMPIERTSRDSEAALTLSRSAW